MKQTKIRGLSYNHPRSRWESSLCLSRVLHKEKSPDGSSPCVSPESHKLRSPAWEINLCLSKGACEKAALLFTDTSATHDI